ncbi:MAG TPA: tetratricopeptide repeat protein [Ignavibacteria bacterium]|nr:tetratricopeptide repeat protein [Ignavibacteria bacterium]HMR40185.1 tetratricopeptide repeat protein [Ignavibacteria bacterium]
MAKHKHQSEEKLMTFWYQIVDFFEKNKKHVYTALTILVIAIAGIVLLVQKKKANNEIAGMEVSKIKPVYEANNFQQAINGDSLGISKGLQYIVDEYGSTDNGETAKIMLANSYYSVRDFDKAEKYYKDYSGDNPILKAASVAGIASVYNAKGQYSEAAKEFEKAASVDKANPFVDQYIFYAATNYFRADNQDEAKKLFTKLKEDYPKSKYVFESEKYKASLN